MISNEKTQLDAIRQKGYRPQVMIVTLWKKHVLFVYKEDYDLWMFPQGGIQNKESIKQAFWREAKEELGRRFVQHFDKNIRIIHKAKSTFPARKQGTRKLFLDSGKEMHLKGKVYFALVVKTQHAKVTIDKTEFNDVHWADYKQAMHIIKHMYQPSKKRIIRKIVKMLKKEGLIK